MIAEQMPLVKQVDMVFKQAYGELSCLTSGVLFMNIRNNIVGKFGVTHDPIESKDVELERQGKGLSEQQVYAFRKMAIQSLKHKAGWTHGDIYFEFALKNGMLVTSVQFESSYNLAHVLQNAKGSY